MLDLYRYLVLYLGVRERNQQKGKKQNEIKTN
jgi:hypothetical protein